MDTNAAGYIIYYGAASGVYTNEVLAGDSDTVTLYSLVAGATYYVAATSYDFESLESSFSPEISFTVPAPGPVLPVQTDKTIAPDATMIVTNTAMGAVPGGALTYQLLNPPSGMLISASGIISWTPGMAQAPSTNLIVTIVSDTSTPPLTSTNSFTVFVIQSVRPTLVSPTLAQGAFSVSFSSLQGKTYSLETNETLDPRTWRTVTSVSGDGTPKTLIDSEPEAPVRFYRVSVE